MRKIVVAITGASGSIYASTLLKSLEAIRNQWTDLSIVMTENAKEVWRTELGDDSFEKVAANFYSPTDFYAPFASGSAKFDTLIIIPCSMGIMGRIAAGISNDLITRAADVILKERRRLILVIRDTPYNLIHIRNMETITQAGGIICPASPSFYSNPKDFTSLVSTVTNRVLDLAGFDISTFRWGK